MPRGGALRPRALTFSLCSALRNETVLHQFCCPAADAEQKPACSDLGPHRWEEPLRVLPSPLISQFSELGFSLKSINSIEWFRMHVFK